ncbi:hypothetical protein D3C71_1821130 [compost metagenome]
MPKTATAISSATPSRYSGTATFMMCCGGTWATTNSSVAAISMLRPWSTKRLPWSKPEEYMAVRPIVASSSTSSTKGPSKPRNSGRMR